MKHLRRKSHEQDAVLITDAELSLDDEQRIRKRVYAVLMVVHLLGLTAAGLLAHFWVLALIIVAVTGPLPWVAVVIANDRISRRTAQRIHRSRPAIEAAPAEPEVPDDDRG